MKLVGLWVLVFVSLAILQAVGASHDGVIFGSLFGGLCYVLAANDGDKS